LCVHFNGENHVGVLCISIRCV